MMIMIILSNDSIVEVEYPDKRVQYWKPRVGDFRSIGTDVYRLRTTVLLSAGQWNDSATVSIGVVLAHNQSRYLDVLSTGVNATAARVKVKIYPKARC
jgi:hypothetical protein